MNNRPSLDNTIASRVGNPDNHHDDHLSEYKKQRKRSILLSMVLPPEAQPAGSSTILQPPNFIPSVLEPGFTPARPSSKAQATAEQDHETSSTMDSLRGWVSGSKDGPNQKDMDAQLTRRGGKHHTDKVANVEHSKATVVSKTSFVRSWISKISKTETYSKDHQLQLSGASVVEDKSVMLVSSGENAVRGTTGHNHGVGTATTTTTTVVQEVHKTRTVALINVNLSVQDVFGLGKVTEMIMALFNAHGSFLSRQPFWLQCAVMAWEGILLMLIVWGLLRVIGLAEVIVWGADDLVRGTLSTIQLVGRALFSLVSS
ncbi:hypothetical protein BGW38_009404 [Lunasporangiospora selenospora]|uniref:Uncharacterized protein n=1 Tax=Lunasporangiospora selenospora TaxID=979761 RepID=A0A9P6KG54_9FUNG|nr:hypothetical protein BGW38_009404 [Lunasporangiospora selenospora]